MSGAIVILGTTEDGALRVRAPATAAAAMRRHGARLDPQGNWLVPARLSAPFKARYAAKPAAPAPSKPPPPEARSIDFTAVDAALGRCKDLGSSRNGVHVKLRLSRRSKAAAEALRSLPGAAWLKGEGVWSLQLRTESQERALMDLPEKLAAAFASGRRSPSAAIERIYAIDEAPNLGEEIEIDGRRAIFDDAGKLFRLNSGHVDRHAWLAGRRGEFACVFYGRWLDHVETAADTN